MIVLVLVIVFFCLAVYGAIYEAIAEKDWPRDMFKYVVGLGAALIIFLLAVACA